MPTWAIVVRWLLYPLQMLIHKHQSYDPYCDVWTIHGRKFSGKMMSELANSEGLEVRINHVNGITTLTHLVT